MTLLPEQTVAIEGRAILNEMKAVKIRDVVLAARAGTLRQDSPEHLAAAALSLAVLCVTEVFDLPEIEASPQ